jgi:hypothetical protein
MPISGPEAAAALPEDLRVAITTFVRERLGCGCADEVFADIAVESIGAGRCRIAIGDRLLIELLPDAAAADGPALLDRGRRERDRRGMNRYRLVLAGAGTAGGVPENAAAGDERLHLHRLPGEELRALIDLCLRAVGPPAPDHSVGG